MVRKDQNGDLLNWISDTFTIDIQDKYGLVQKYTEPPTIGTSVVDNSFREVVSDNRIFFTIWLRCEDVPPNFKAHNWSKENTHYLMNKYYNELGKDLETFIKKVYTKVEIMKMKLNWRESTNEPRIEIPSSGSSNRNIHILRILIYFGIDDTYDWEEEKKNSDLRVHNMMKSTFGEDSAEFKKWLEIRNKKNESFRIRKFR